MLCSLCLLLQAGLLLLAPQSAPAAGHNWQQYKLISCSSTCSCHHMYMMQFAWQWCHHWLAACQNKLKVQGEQKLQVQGEQKKSPTPLAAAWYEQTTTNHAEQFCRHYAHIDSAVSKQLLATHTIMNQQSPIHHQMQNGSFHGMLPQQKFSSWINNLSVATIVGKPPSYEHNPEALLLGMYDLQCHCHTVLSPHGEVIARY